MTVEQKIKEQYTTLCQTLGDLTLKKKKLDEQVLDLESQIQSLLTYAPELIKTEQERMKDERSKCSNCACDVGSDSN